MVSKLDREQRRESLLTCLDLFDRLCAVHLAVKVIKEISIFRSGALDFYRTKKFATKWSIRRTLGSEEDFAKFVDRCNNVLLPRLNLAADWKEAAMIVDEFAQQNCVKTKDGKLRKPRSAVSKISHFYKPIICPVYDGYALKALCLPKNSTMCRFSEEFERAFQFWRHYLFDTIILYQEKGGKLLLESASSDILERRLLDTMLMKAAGREI